MTALDILELKKRLLQYSQEDRRKLFMLLREEFPIHNLEREFNCPAEVILEAISRGTDLTKRGVRGLIAEAYFEINVVPLLISMGWQKQVIDGDKPADFMFVDSIGSISIQIKMQRKKEQRVMLAREASKRMYPSCGDMWVVETQKTRGGMDSNKNDTRPYRYGEFDILGVSLQPALNDWSKFVYTVSSWLIPDPKNNGSIFKYQPVPNKENEDWTFDIIKCITWFREKREKTISMTW